MTLSDLQSHLPSDAILLFCLLGGLFGFLLWGRFRYDLIAFSALLVALTAGLVPKEDAFSGFGHPATVIIALVLIVSRGLINSGAIGHMTRMLIKPDRGLAGHIGIMASLAAGLSAIMNNVGALALLMPVDIQAAKKAGRSVSFSLMPLSFATILGGMVTLIGTPPNIIISSYREEVLGAPYAMFDFAWVGLGTALAGVLFVALLGWRLIPKSSQKPVSKATSSVEAYLSEIGIPEKADITGVTLNDIIEDAEKDDVLIVGLIRRGKRIPGNAFDEIVRKDDRLVVRASVEDLDAYVAKHKLSFSQQPSRADLNADGLMAMEVVVPETARVVGRSARDVRLQYRFATHLLGISRPSGQFETPIRRTRLQPGDVLLLAGPDKTIDDVVSWMGCMSLAERGFEITRFAKAGRAAGIFAIALLLASLNLLYLPIALGIVCVLYVLLDIVPLRTLYDNIEWPIIVLLGSLIPIGTALESSGGTAMIAQGILSITDTFGLGAVAVLVLLLIVTMTLSDVLNNTATTVIAAPIALDIATRLQVNPDGFLMAVAVGASCAFLTPIGHKNNTLVMGPGGYRFADYWRLGLPLEILIVIVAVPLILIFWPL